LIIITLNCINISNWRVWSLASRYTPYAFKNYKMISKVKS